MMRNGVHLGHVVNRWNPQMKPFLVKNRKRVKLSKNKSITLHLIDLVKTASHLNYLASRLTKTAAQKKTILFVGTGKEYAPLVSRIAKVCKAYYVNEKWLGGMLTNWDTLRLSTDRLRKYDVLMADGSIQSMPKKEGARAYKDQNKLHRTLGGIKFMLKKPDLVIVVGQTKETNALKECKKLNIPSISITDSDCHPMASDMIVPANDDSLASIQFIFKTIATAVKRGQLLIDEQEKPRTYLRRYQKNPLSATGKRQVTSAFASATSFAFAEAKALEAEEAEAKVQKENTPKPNKESIKPTPLQAELSEKKKLAIPPKQGRATMPIEGDPGWYNDHSKKHTDNKTPKRKLRKPFKKKTI